MGWFRLIMKWTKIHYDFKTHNGSLSKQLFDAKEIKKKKYS